jgi:hypothetical protein
MSSSLTMTRPSSAIYSSSRDAEIETDNESDNLIWYRLYINGSYKIKSTVDITTKDKCISTVKELLKKKHRYLLKNVDADSLQIYSGLEHDNLREGHHSWDSKMDGGSKQIPLIVKACKSASKDEECVSESDNLIWYKLFLDDIFKLKSNVVITEQVLGKRIYIHDILELVKKKHRHIFKKFDTDSLQVFSGRENDNLREGRYDSKIDGGSKQYPLFVKAYDPEDAMTEYKWNMMQHRFGNHGLTFEEWKMVRHRYNY